MAIQPIENNNFLAEGTQIINRNFDEVPVTHDLTPEGDIEVIKQGGQKETIPLSRQYARLEVINELLTELFNAAGFRFATEDEMDEATPRVIVDPAALEVWYAKKQAGTGEEGELTGINKVLDIENKATIPLILKNGGLFTGKGTDSENKDIRLKFDLETAPLKGSYGVIVVEQNSKTGYFMPLPTLNDSLKGDIVQVPTADPGPPVAVAIPEIVISSGENLNTVLPAFTKADGTPYPYTIAYAVKGQPSGFSFTPTFRRLTGNKTVSVETTWPLILEGIVGEGLQEGTRESVRFNLRVLAAVAQTFPQPTITQTAAISIVQGQATNLQLYVTYPGGITKAGTWSIAGLPSGLSINPATGTFPGAPTTPGEYLATATWRDSDNQTDDMQFTITVTANPVNAWLLGVFYWTDYNTGGADFGLRLASGTATALVAVEALDATVYTGNGANGSTVGTDPGGAGYWQSVVPSTGNSEFNVRAGFYPFSISPKIGGLATGKAYKVKIKRPGDSASVDFYFYFNPVQNVPVSPMLTSPPDAGTGTNQLTPPTVGPQSLIAGQATSKQFNDFTGWQAGEEKTISITGIPAGVTFAYNTTSGKFDFAALTSGALDATIGVVATGNLGSYGSFSFQVTSTVALSNITTIYRKYTTYGIGAIGSIVYFGRVTYGVVVSGNQIVEANTNRSGTPESTSWSDLTKGSNGRFEVSAGLMNAGETFTVKFRIKGQTAEIVQSYTVLDPLSDNSAAEIQVWPNNVPGNSLTPNQLMRVGQPDPQNPVFTPSVSWITGFDGAQWLRVTATLATATYSWKVFLNGEPVSGFPIDLPQHTQATIDVMDSNNYDPYASDIAKKAQLILYTGTPSGSTVIQNT